MKEPVKVTMIQLRDYLLAQRPDKPINMASGCNDGPGCLMTQYGRDHEFTFEYCSALQNNWTGKDNSGSYTEAVLDGYVFDLFYRIEDLEYDAAYKIGSRYSKDTCGYWMDMLKDKTNK